MRIIVDRKKKFQEKWGQHNVENSWSTTWQRIQVDAFNEDGSFSMISQRETGLWLTWDIQEEI